MEAPSSTAGRPLATETAGWEAALTLRFVRDGQRTRLADNRHRGPLRLLKALASDDGRRLDAVIVHPPGGLVSGDRLQIDVEAAAGSAVLLTTPGAQKWYRPLAQVEARVETRLVLGAEASVDWLPQPSILFDGARATQSLSIAMSASASCVGWEMLVRGRAAMGERWSSGHIDQTLMVAVDGRPRWRQRLLADAGDRAFSSLLGWRDRLVAASIWFCAPTSPAGQLTTIRDQWRAAIARFTGDRSAVDEGRPLVGATQAGEGLVLAQLLGDDVEQVQRCAMALWRLARATESGPAPDPRIWRT